MGCEKDNIVDIDTVIIINGDDDISNMTFSLTVDVVFSTSGNATVNSTTDDFNVTINGNDVTIIYSGEDNIMYQLSGTTTDGFFKLYSAKKQGITLNGVDITNPNGAAINVQGTTTSPGQGKGVFIVLNGSNILADGSSYTDTPTGEDEKGVLFSEGQLVFSGEGEVIVKAMGKSGIVSDDYIVFNGGVTTVNVSSNAYYDSEDSEYKSTAGIKVNDDFTMFSGSLTVTHSGIGGKGITGGSNGYFKGGTVSVTVTGSNYSSGGGGFPGGGGSSNDSNSKSAKGIKFDGNLVFVGGKVIVRATAHEGIEAKGTLTVTGGEVYSFSQSDDAINSGGNFTVKGGFVYGYSVGNDGLDANGNFYLQGGLVFAIGATSPEVAIDANTEGGYRLYLTGGTLIAIGGLERGASLTQSCYQTSNWSSNTWYAMTVGSTIYAFKTPSSGGSGLVVSGVITPTLTSDVTVSGGTDYFNGNLILDGSISGGSSVTLSEYTGGGGNGPGGGGHGPF